MQRSADALAREHTDEAIETVAQIMRDPFAEDRDRLKAAGLILDRGHGTAVQAVIQIPLSKKQAMLAAKYSDEELDQVIMQAQLPRLCAPQPAPTLDAEFHPVVVGHDPLLD